MLTTQNADRQKILTAGSAFCILDYNFLERQKARKGTKDLVIVCHREPGQLKTGAGSRSEITLEPGAESARGRKGPQCVSRLLPGW